jgi:hypothetical protein
MTEQASQAAANFFEGLAEELDVSDSRYAEAKRRYESVGRWLGRPESTLRPFSPEVYVQGSFRLGTPIRPVNEDEHYDIDLVCELRLQKSGVTQRQVKAMLGHEMALYAKAHNMKEPGESRRCWTLDYAEGAQFHLDALPAIPDATGKRVLLEASNQQSAWVETAIAITDTNHPAYERLAHRWPHSNPKGFTNWFRSRMVEAFRTQRAAMALREHAAKVEHIPSYRVRTPLQQAVQVLKRHRDLMFAEYPAHKPISVVITTLAGQGYQQESNVATALAGILSRMDQYIEDRGGVVWIANPTDPQENFADKWVDTPALEVSFARWLQQARADFQQIGAQTNRERIVEVASKAFGERTARAAGAMSQFRGGGSAAPSFRQRLASVFQAAHKKPAPWQVNSTGWVRIDKAVVRQNGFQASEYRSDGPALAKGKELTFEAATNVPAPFDVYWQVVNSGPEAEAVPGGLGLRGGFDQGVVERGSIKKVEQTGYAGTHTIECFIVKSGYLAANSGPFVVNIK